MDSVTDMVSMLDFETLRSVRTEHRLKLLYLLYNNKAHVDGAPDLIPVLQVNTHCGYTSALFT